MVPYDLYRLLRCPTCGSRDLLVTDAGVHCAGCRNDYPRREGYLDLMPRAVEFDYVSKYVSEEEQLAEELDYRDLAPPLLAAGVRNRALVRRSRWPGPTRAACPSPTTASTKPSRSTCWSTSRAT